jgi:hypothetical protein
MAEQSLSDPLTTGVHADVEATEEAFVAQWTNYGHAPGRVFHEDDDLVWAEAPVPQLPTTPCSAPGLGGMPKRASSRC